MKKINFYFSPPLIALIVYTSMVLLCILSLKYFTLLSAPVLFSLIIAYLFNPLVNYIEKKTILSRFFISAILMVLLSLIFIFLIVNLLPYVIDQIKNAADKLPEILSQFSEKAKVISNYLTKNFSEYVGNIDIMGKIEEMISNSLTDLSKLLIGAFSSLYGFIITLLYLVFIPLFSYYFIKDYYKIKLTLFSLVPNRFQESFRRRVMNMDNILSSFIRGQAIVVIILAILYSIGLSIIGLPFSILIGIFAGLGDIVPYLGTIVGFITSLIVGIVHFNSIEKLLLIVLVFVIVKGSENWFFYPKIVGREVGLHFVWVLISIIIFGQLFGFWGLLVAIPSSAGFKMFIGELVKYYKKSYFFKKE